MKGKTGHKFISASVSNSMLCDVCGKALAHKAALRCESEYSLIDIGLAIDPISPPLGHKPALT